jgi:hypothetical protein
MKKFIKRIAIYIFLVFFAVFTLFAVCPSGKDLYVLAYSKKCERLDTLQSPRIIFVGGSYLAFGLNSRAVADSLHINVVNAGLNSGFGMRFMIDDAESYVRRGDILVIVPNYGHFYRGFDGGTSGDLTSAIEQSKWKKLTILNASQLTNVIAGIPNLLRTKLMSSLHEASLPYSTKGFNEYGDEESHWTLPNVKSPDDTPIVGEFNEEYGRYFIKKVESLEKKVKVYIVPSVIDESSYSLKKKEIDEVTDFLLSKRHPFLFDPTECVLDESCTYDGHFHMNKRGVDLYTEKIIDELKKEKK